MKICTRGEIEQATERGLQGGHKPLPTSGRASVCVRTSAHSAFEGDMHVTQSGGRMDASRDQL